MNNGEFYLSDAIGVIEEVLESGGEFLLSPKGTSMLPLIVQGEDRVVLKKYGSVSPKKYDIAFYRRANGAFVLHRILKIKKDGTFVMCGDNQTQLEYGILPEQLIGYVSLIHKGERTIDPTSLRYRCYVCIWCFLPYRHCVRFIQRVFRRIKRKLFHRL
ncbi:MAG: S24/S26 family peptidase [Clostridia bacterium]|nr:S24/S26 family peptidase [Clostridia bacterium]